MADLAITTPSFTPGTVISSSQIATDLADIVNYINNRNTGTASWDVLSVAGALTLTSTLQVSAATTLLSTLAVTAGTTLSSTLGVTGAATLSNTLHLVGAGTFDAALTVGTTLGVTGASTFTGGVANLFGYRRPSLTYISATQVDVENNTGTANQTTIVFPDGTIRSVTENTGSTHKYRRFDITATAEFTTGTEDSGLYNGLSEGTNTWYAIYAVKSTIDAAKFVLVGTTTQPTQANYATLNSNLGTNGWVYLGMIRNGDQKSATTDIVAFIQTGGTVQFKNAVVPTGSLSMTGIVLAGGTNSAAYSYTTGTDNTGMPVHFRVVTYSAGTTQTSAASMYIQDSAGNITFARHSSASIGVIPVPMPVAGGCKTGDNVGGGASFQITLSGWLDPLLGGAYSVI